MWVGVVRHQNLQGFCLLLKKTSRIFTVRKIRDDSCFLYEQPFTTPSKWGHSTYTVAASVVPDEKFFF